MEGRVVGWRGRRRSQWSKEESVGMKVGVRESTMGCSDVDVQKSVRAVW